MGQGVAVTTLTRSWLKKSENYQQQGAGFANEHEKQGVQAPKHCQPKRMVTSTAGCEGMATTITATHYSIWRHLYNSMKAARTPQSTLEFVTLDKENNMNTLWQRE